VRYILVSEDFPSKPNASVAKVQQKTRKIAVRYSKRPSSNFLSCFWSLAIRSSLSLLFTMTGCNFAVFFCFTDFIYLQRLGGTRVFDRSGRRGAGRDRSDPGRLALSDPTLPRFTSHFSHHLLIACRRPLRRCLGENLRGSERFQVVQVKFSKIVVEAAF